MVGGLFAKSEHAAVMSALERSVVFLTPDNVEPVLESSSWLHTTWVLANMYLLSIGAEALSPEAPFAGPRGGSMGVHAITDDITR